MDKGDKRTATKLAVGGLIGAILAVAITQGESGVILTAVCAVLGALGGALCAVLLTIVDESPF